MIAKELYEYTKQIMFEKPNSKDFNYNWKAYINMLLAENFELNNGLRCERNLPKLYRVPFIESEDDNIPYELEICYEVLANGLASKLFVDDDLTKFNLFNTEYKNAQARYVRFRAFESEEGCIYDRS